jgi:NADH-quinone oxidoreductase subunit L
MTIPLVVLAVFAIIGGWVGLPDGLLWGDAFAKFLSPVVGDFKPAVPASAAMLSAVATGLGGIGILVAYVCYLRMPDLPQLVASRLKGLYDLLLEKYRIDELYDLLVTRPLFFISDQVLNRGIDQFVIDGTANRTGLAVEGGGEAARRVETGNVQHYAFVYLLGVIGIVAYYLYLVMR